MKRLICFLLVVYLCNNIYSQSRFTGIINIPEVIFTATRTANSLENIPGRLEIISQQIIQDFPANSIDDLLIYVPGLNVNRSWGIFSKNSSVNMRGISGTGRVLVLFNGLPLNKSAGGGINWHMINTDMVQRIEISKGPGSAVYGNNAMTGVINIITKQPINNIAGNIKAEVGSYGTIGTSINLNSKKKSPGFFWDANFSTRIGDGYILEPIENRDSTDSNAYLKELITGVSAGYQFKNSILELSNNFYIDKRGTGTKIYEPEGSYLSYTTNYSTIKYKGKYKKLQYEFKSYFQFQNYFEENESFNNYGSYKLYTRNQTSLDNGLWINVTRRFGDNQRITVGIDSRTATFDASDDYKTSSDFLSRSGKTSMLAFFVQDEISLAEEKINIVAGLRMDLSWFYDGDLRIINPTKNTGFIESEEILFNSSKWSYISPRFVIKYNSSEKVSTYLSYSVGFMPATLDDLCSSRKINRGFKIANPNLKPEKLYNYETGFNSFLFDNIELRPSIYLSQGKDFQYFVGTGDSINTGGLSLKPILRRENISNVLIGGGEIAINYRVSDNIIYNTSYSYNYSTITSFMVDSMSATDLTGKKLTEVPFHQFYSGINWKNSWLNVFFNTRYIGYQFYDDENKHLIDPFWQFDINLSRDIKDNLKANLSIQDILNNKHIDKKGLLSPGRYISVSLRYSL